MITTSLVLVTPPVATKHFFPEAHFQWQHVRRILDAYWIYIDVYPYAVHTLPKIVSALHSQHWLMITLFIAATIVKLNRDPKGRYVWAHTTVLLGLVLTLGSLLEIPLLWLWMPHHGAGVQTTRGLLLCFITFGIVGFLCVCIALPLWLFLELRGKKWYRNSSSGQCYPLNWSGKRGSLFTLESDDERFVEELRTLAWRRRHIKITALVLYGSFLTIGFTQSNALIITLSFIVMGSLVYESGLLFHELSYQLGAQFMHGAFVFNLNDDYAGRNVVEHQKAHGFLRTPSPSSSDAHLKRL